MMTPDEPTQTAALLSSNELTILLSAMGTLWASLCGSVLIVWQLIKRNWLLMEARIGKLEDKVDGILTTMHEMLGDHEEKDRVRHEQQLEAIRRNAEAYTAPWAAMQESQKTLTDRVGQIEDTPPNERGRRKR